MKKVSINSNIEIGTGAPLLLIAGPCQIESLEHCLMLAEKIKEACHNLPVSPVFKSSFDKANRTSANSQRGPGITRGLEILAAVKKETSLPVITDIHLPEEAAVVAEVVDIIQTPAFLCRQTDLLIAAGKTGLPINVKKGQFLHPADMKYCIEKIESTGNQKTLLCERGTCLGYRDLVVDMRSLAIMKSLGAPVVFDATHSVQNMGGAGGSSTGNREYVPLLARSATAAGIDGLFLEVHDQPDQAPSDGPNMLQVDQLRPLLETLCKIREAAACNANQS